MLEIDRLLDISPNRRETPQKRSTVRDAMEVVDQKRDAIGTLNCRLLEDNNRRVCSLGLPLIVTAETSRLQCRSNVNVFNQNSQLHSLGAW